MDDIYLRMLNKAELRRIERIEIFDEFEEWHMIQVNSRCRKQPLIFFFILTCGNVARASLRVALLNML